MDIIIVSWEPCLKASKVVSTKNGVKFECTTFILTRPMIRINCIPLYKNHAMIVTTALGD